MSKPHTCLRCDLPVTPDQEEPIPGFTPPRYAHITTGQCAAALARPTLHEWAAGPFRRYGYDPNGMTGTCDSITAVRQGRYAPQ